MPTEVFSRISSSGSTRLGDTEMTVDGRVREAIKDRGIILTTWKELMRRRATVGQW